MLYGRPYPVAEKSGWRPVVSPMALSRLAESDLTGRALISLFQTLSAGKRGHGAAGAVGLGGAGAGGASGPQPREPWPGPAGWPTRPTRRSAGRQGSHA